MEDAGYSPDTQLALDDGWLGFVQQFERMRDATHMVPMEERPKGAKPMVPAPLYSREHLLRALDIETDEPSGSRVVDNAIQPSDWGAIDWGDEDEEVSASSHRP